MSNTIDTSLYLSEYQSKKSAGPAKVLDKDDFLKLLITQLKHQDPLNPMEDKEYIAQMAQFSSLEQMINISTAMDRLLTVTQQNMLLAYSQLIGKEIAWTKIVDGGDTSDGTPYVEEGKGLVRTLQFENGTVSFVLEDGTVIAPENVSGIGAASSENALVQACMLIGKMVTYIDQNNHRQKETVTSVSFHDGKTIFHLGDSTGITADQIIKIE